MQASITQLDSLYEDYIWSRRWPPRSLSQNSTGESKLYEETRQRGTLDLVAFDKVVNQ